MVPLPGEETLQIQFLSVFDSMYGRHGSIRNSEKQYQDHLLLRIYFSSNSVR